MRYSARLPGFLVFFAVPLVGFAAAGGQEPLPEAPEKLVALLVGENLPRSSQNRGRSYSIASQAAAALIAKRDDAVPALAAGLDSRDALQRLNVVFVLTHIGTPATLAPRLRAARDEGAAVRAAAIRPLPVYASRESHQAAWSAFSDPDSKVQEAAMMAFARPRREGEPSFGIERYYAAQRIAEFLKDQELRPTAAWVLGQLGSKVAVRQLLAAMDDPRHEVRYEIIASLGQIGDKQATIGIAQHLRDSDRGVRCAAASALGRLRDLRGTPALAAALADSDAPVRRDAAAALGSIGDWRGAAPLIEALADPDDDVGRAAARALGGIGDRQAVPALIQSLERTERAETAAAALRQLRDPRAISALGQYLERNLDSDAAAQALAKIRHPDAVAELARVASTQKSLAARRGLRAIADVGFDFEPPETVASWWKEHRGEFLRPLPAKSR
jgi:HEAT repeat protein